MNSSPCKVRLLAMAVPEVGLGHHVLFGAGGQTQIHPAILAALLLAIILVLVLPRKYVIAPLLLLSIPIPLGQVVMIGALHFQLFRILAIFGWVRLLVTRYGAEGRSSQMSFNSVDKAMIFYSICCV